MADRRRLNGPANGTSPPIFTDTDKVITKPSRSRKANELRSIFLQTGIIPTADGSAYLELKSSSDPSQSLLPTSSTIKLSCSVHGPKPLSRNTSFSPNLQLTASIKFAPFATRCRRGYIRDSIERDLGSHLENALKGVIIPDRWPKSSIDVAVIVVEGEEDCLWTQEQGNEKGMGGIGLMNVLAGSITVAAAALADARIDCLDLLTGGVAATVTGTGTEVVEVLDPSPSEHEEILSACVVGYLPSRDEVTEVWSKGCQTEFGGNLNDFERLLNNAIRAARGTHTVLIEAMKESAMSKALINNAGADHHVDVAMKS